MPRSPQPPARDLVFFLGGRDLEMTTIRELLDQEAPDRVVDGGLGWGAEVSAYREEIEAALGAGRTPVLVELADDLGLGDRALHVDHHGDLAGANRPTALHQVFDLLELPPERWTRDYELVAANDRGYLPALQAVGASREEIRRIRAADRRAQGIREEEEQAAAAAAEDLEVLAGGRLQVARLPHARTAALVDRLQPELGGPGFRNLLVLAPGEVNFYGEGPWIEHLDRTFPGGWKGGELPERGFWGRNGEGEEVLEALRGWMEKAEGGGDVAG